MEEKYTKYLPIGTVVLLKNGTAKVMITGFMSVSIDDTSKVYDYCGCIYPDGFMSSDQFCMFDHNQITKIYHLGLYNDEAKKFKQELIKFNKEKNNKIDIF